MNASRKTTAAADVGANAIGQTFLTPKQVAEVLVIDAGAVIRLIRSCQLQAVLVSESIRSRKPRYRVSPEALQRFIDSRTVQPPPKRPARRPAYERNV